MSMTVYGCSDDLIELDGDLNGELNSFAEGPVWLRFSDGTELEVEYAPGDLAVWKIQCLKAGPLFDHVDPCEDEDAKIYSDVAYFTSGMEWAEWRAKDRHWVPVRC